MIVLLRLCHWIVFGYAWILAVRVAVDAVVLFELSIRERLLPLQNILVAITDPALEPIRAVIRPRNPDQIDPSAFIAVILCIALDFLIVAVTGRL